MTHAMAEEDRKPGGEYRHQGNAQRRPKYEHPRKHPERCRLCHVPRPSQHVFPRHKRTLWTYGNQVKLINMVCITK